LVDDEDFVRLAKYAWRLQDGYAVRTESHVIHRDIMKRPDNMRIDHIDGNRLNCTKSNMRVATPQQNSFNRRKLAGTSSRFKGVSFHKVDKKWKAYITIDGRDCQLGTFTNEQHAGLMYDFWATLLQGEFVKPNFQVVSQWTAP
jgi:hypothetical protein